MGKGSKKQHGLLENLRKRISPAIEGLGYELYDLEELLSEGKRILRVSIDQEQGIQIDDCIRVDQLMQSLLEDEDPVEGAYILEVSSPGIFRALKDRRHFQRYSGERISIRLKQKIDGMRQTVGMLKGALEEGILFVPEKKPEEEFLIAYEKISKARLEPELN